MTTKIQRLWPLKGCYNLLSELLLKVLPSLFLKLAPSPHCVIVFAGSNTTHRDLSTLMSRALMIKFLV